MCVCACACVRVRACVAEECVACCSFAVVVLLRGVVTFNDLLPLLRKKQEVFSLALLLLSRSYRLLVDLVRFLAC